MPLTNKQYDTIMREYDRRQYQDYRLQCTRIDQIYEQIPRIREIDSEISACSLRQAERMIDREPGAMKSLKDELTLLKAEKEGLLLSAGYPATILRCIIPVRSAKTPVISAAKSAIAFYSRRSVCSILLPIWIRFWQKRTFPICLMMSMMRSRSRSCRSTSIPVISLLMDLIRNLRIFCSMVP